MDMHVCVFVSVSVCADLLVCTLSLLWFLQFPLTQSPDQTVYLCLCLAFFITIPSSLHFVQLTIKLNFFLMFSILCLN